VLFHSADPPSSGCALHLGDAPELLAPPAYHSIRPDENVAPLRDAC
jgi:hypothetical protein